MKKRIVSLALIFCILCISLTLTACKESTFSIVSKALDKTENLESMHAEMSLEMNMAMDGMTLSIPITADIKATGIHGDSPVISTDIAMSMFGQNVETEMYQEGEWTYMIIDDMKYKTKVSDGESEFDYSDDVNNMIQEIPEELFKNVDAINGNDGSMTVTIPIPDEFFSDIYSDFVDDINSSTGVEGTDVKIKDAIVKITVLNGYISVYDMEFKMDMTVYDVATTTDVKASVTYKDPGKEITITPPEGYQSFEELDLSVAD